MAEFLKVETQLMVINSLRHSACQLVTALLGCLMLSAQAIADVQPPSGVSGINATILSNSTIRLNWDRSRDNRRVAGYNIYKNGDYLQSSLGESFTDRSVRPGIAYRYQISAFDANNNISELSSVYRVRFTRNMLVNTAASGNAEFNNNSTNTIAQVSIPSNNNPVSGAISAPRNIRGSQIENGTIRWRWSSIAAAARYEVTVDGNYAGQTSDTQYTSQGLWIGEHSVSIKAVSSQGEYSAQSETAKATIRGDFSSGGNVDELSDESLTSAGSQRDTGLVDPLSLAMNEVQNKTGYTLTFSDEFNGNTLNRNRWNTQLRWDGDFNGERYEYRIINNENQFYVNPFSEDQEHRDLLLQHHNPFELDGSRLAIRAIKNPLRRRDYRNSYGSLRSMVDQQHFLSGVITTYDKFVQKYGYFEARVKIPGHVGAFPAFWLHHQRLNAEGTQRTEIDIMENLGHAPWYIYNSFHYYTNVSRGYEGDANFLRPQPDGQIYSGTDYSLGYHTYAIEWEPGRITWYIDGRRVSRLNNSNVDHEELYLLMNLAVGGDWTNFSSSLGGLGRSSGERFPAGYDLDNFTNPALEIDFIRVYRRN